LDLIHPPYFSLPWLLHISFHWYILLHWLLLDFYCLPIRCLLTWLLPITFYWLNSLPLLICLQYFQLQTNSRGHQPHITSSVHSIPKTLHLLDTEQTQTLLLSPPNPTFTIYQHYVCVPVDLIEISSCKQKKKKRKRIKRLW
jgi:hypothetical protein